ncbi:MAG: hypothetical protein U0T82_02355 [Bacteroidales bacterium]
MRKNLFPGIYRRIQVLLLSCFFSLGASGKVLTVSNSELTAAQYTSLQAAITAALAGDTIYVHGSQTSYGDALVNKRLVLIGPGYTPLNPTTPSARIENITLDTLSGLSGAGRTFIMGLSIGNIGLSNNYQSMKCVDITVKRNWITGYIYMGNYGPIRNWLIEENNVSAILPNFDQPNSGNNLLRNNIIGYMPSMARAMVVNNVINTSTIFNECTISNNIFMVPESDNTSGFSTFNNNLFSSNVNFNSGTSTLVGTIIGDPLLVGSGNYHLQAGSIAIGAGTDGKDLGIYGGSGFTDGGIPPIPSVYFYNISPNYIPVGGSLKITVKARNQ